MTCFVHCWVLADAAPDQVRAKHGAMYTVEGYAQGQLHYGGPWLGGHIHREGVWPHQGVWVLILLEPPDRTWP